MSGQNLERSSFSTMFRLITGRDLSAPGGSINVPVEDPTRNISPEPYKLSSKAAAWLDLLERELDLWHNTHCRTWWRGMTADEVERERWRLRRR